MPRELRWKGKLLVLENVPTGLCRQFGEKFLKPAVLKAIDRIVQEEKEPLRTMEAPLSTNMSLTWPNPALNQTWQTPPLRLARRWTKPLSR